MVTTVDEYNAHLALIQNVNAPVYALLPKVEATYPVNIYTREIDAPPFISVEQDHKSETLYFEIDRYNGYMDLSQTSCLIHYKNPLGEGRFYMVPFYDIMTKADEGKMLFPWCVDAWATKTTGTLTFSIQFFKLGEPEFNSDTNQTERPIIYNFNTRPATTQILKGFNVVPDVENDAYFLSSTQADVLQQRIDQLARWSQLYWTVLSTKDDEEVVDINLQETIDTIIEDKIYDDPTEVPI